MCWRRRGRERITRGSGSKIATKEKNGPKYVKKECSKRSREAGRRGEWEEGRGGGAAAWAVALRQGNAEEGNSNSDPGRGRTEATLGRAPARGRASKGLLCFQGQSLVSCRRALCLSAETRSPPRRASSQKGPRDLAPPPPTYSAREKNLTLAQELAAEAPPHSPAAAPG